jgi:CRP-like cAMP-binding protein
MSEKADNASLSTAETVEILRSSLLLRGALTDQIAYIALNSSRRRVDTGDIVFTEGDDSTDVHIILAGAVEVVRTDAENARPFRIAELSAGDHFGEISLVEGEARSATVRAVEPTLLLSLSQEDLERIARDNRPLYATIVTNLTRELSRRLRATNELALGAMKSELKHEKARRSMGAFLIKNLLFLSAYVVGLNVFAEYATGGAVPMDVGIKMTIAAALFIKVANAVFAVAMMKRGQYPMAFYGFSSRGWKRHVGWSLAWTLGFIGAMTLIKWVLVSTVPSWQYEPVFNFQLAPFLFNVHDTFSYAAAACLFVILYFVLAAAQEIIVRASIQNPLSQFLMGKYRVFWSIVISNAIFASTHVHINALFPFLIFFPGLFWGVMYFRQRSLVGVIVSHTLVGCWAFLGLGVFMA